MYRIIKWQRKSAIVQDQQSFQPAQLSIQMTDKYRIRILL